MADAKENDDETISPPAWGWPEDALKAIADKADFPTCVGMARETGLPEPRLI